MNDDFILRNPPLDEPLRETCDLPLNPLSPARPGIPPSAPGSGATPALEGPPEGLVARVWAPNTNAFSPGEVWVATSVPITIWSGAEVITSWYDRWARPRRVVTGPMSALRYTVTAVNTSDIAAAQVIVWNNVGGFSGIPTPPAALGNTVLPASGLPSTVVAYYAPGSPTATMDSTSLSGPLAVLTYGYEYNGSDWVGTPLGAAVGVAGSKAIVVDAFTVTMSNPSNAATVSVVLNSLDAALTVRSYIASPPTTGEFTVDVRPTYSNAAVRALGYYLGKPDYGPASATTYYWMGDRTTAYGTLNIASPGTPEVGDAILLTLVVRELSFVSRPFPNTTPFLPESTAGYSFP